MLKPTGLDLADPHFEAVLDAIELPIVILDSHCRIVRANAAWRAATPVVAGTPYGLAASVSADALREVCEGRAERGEHTASYPALGGHTYTARCVCVRRDEPRLYLVTHLPVQTLSGEALALKLELDAARQQLVQAQKLESVGRLSAGVAHDFNNMLTSIICFTRFVVDEMVAEDPRRADLIEVLKSADRAARLTGQLLAFSRRKPLQPVAVNVNDAVSSVGRVLRRTLGEHIELVIEPSDEALWVQCDPGQFDQLLFNLAVQARDALPGGGTIVIRLGRAYQEGALDVRAADYVELSFLHKHGELTASAAAAAAVQSDEGAGLGLATCRMIAEQAEGSLETISDDTHAGYRVLLPAAEVRAGGASRISLTPIALTGTVLIVEDQPAILRTMARALSATGLTVLEAGSAEDALAVLDARPQLKLALVVTDVVLPRMSGPHLAEQLRQRYPGLPVLLVSGYVGDDVSAELQSVAATAFVTKPFTGRQLAVRAAALLAPRTRSLAPAGA